MSSVRAASPWRPSWCWPATCSSCTPSWEAEGQRPGLRSVPDLPIPCRSFPRTTASTWRPVAIRVDKPVGWTSFDVVNKVRYALKALAGKRVKVGARRHPGPLASGLLLLGYGPGTKRLEELTGLDKTYEGTIRLGP